MTFLIFCSNCSSTLSLCIYTYTYIYLEIYLQLINYIINKTFFPYYFYLFLSPLSSFIISFHSCHSGFCLFSSNITHKHGTFGHDACHPAVRIYSIVDKLQHRFLFIPPLIEKYHFSSLRGIIPHDVVLIKQISSRNLSNVLTAIR